MHDNRSIFDHAKRIPRALDFDSYIIPHAEDLPVIRIHQFIFKLLRVKLERMLDLNMKLTFETSCAA